MSDAAAQMDRMYRHQRHIYDLTRKAYLVGRDEAIARLRPAAGQAALEIGCGTGRNLVRAAKAYPEARFFGLDVSREMLATAAAAIAGAGLAGRIVLAQGDATDFDARKLFGQSGFDRVLVSYALSMIPPWRAALAHALDLLAPGGELHCVDFGDGAGLPRAFRSGLRRWLKAFDVVPRDDLGATLGALAAERGFAASFEPWRGSYATIAVARAPV